VRDIETRIVRTLIESRVPIVIFSWRNEPGWPVEFVSPNAEHVLGYSAADFLSGRVVYEKIIHPDDLARVSEEVSRHGSSGEPVFEHEDYRIIDPSGIVRWVRDNTAVVRDESGRITHFFGYIFDSTARHEALQAVELARAEAEAAARAKSDFLANVSHELRTPLTLILGPIESLLSGELGPMSAAAARSLERVARNAERLYELVNDLLDYSRFTAGMQRVNWSQVDVVTLLRTLVDDAQETARSAGLDLRFAVEGEIGAIPADRRKLERIALNLIGNALKFTPAGGRVEVTIRALGDDLGLVVTDTGPGIPAGDLERIFGRFEQGDASRTRKHEGTGIGLAIVKSFTELMGGTVRVESEVGKGSRFTVRLPRRADQLVSAMVEDERVEAKHRELRLRREPETLVRPAAPTDVTRTRVVVAEDNPDMRGFMREVLGDDHDVEAVATGAAALDAVRRAPPAVVVCDVMMPGIDGLEVARRMKIDPELRHIPIIVVTARAGRDEIVGGLQAGADDYLAKPFSAMELRARVHAAERLHDAYLDVARKHHELEIAHERLRTTQEQLVQAGKLAAVGSLTAGISHELNNPMATIVLNTERLLRQTPQGAPLHTRLEVIARHAHRCSELMRALLELAREKPSASSRVPVARLLEDVETVARSQARGRDVIVESATPPKDLQDVEVSVQDLETALLNLVSNALEATPRGGRISFGVRSRAHDGQPGVEIAVTDTGNGIPPNVLPHIFDPFFTTKQTGERAGLGLALAQRIVQNAGGHIGVDTKVGRGTTMRVWLAGAPNPRVSEHGGQA